MFLLVCIASINYDTSIHTKHKYKYLVLLPIYLRRKEESIRVYRRPCKLWNGIISFIWNRIDSIFFGSYVITSRWVSQPMYVIEITIPWTRRSNYNLIWMKIPPEKGKRPLKTFSIQKTASFVFGRWKLSMNREHTHMPSLVLAVPFHWWTDRKNIFYWKYVPTPGMV